MVQIELREGCFFQIMLYVTFFIQFNVNHQIYYTIDVGTAVVSIAIQNWQLNDAIAEVKGKV